MLLPVEGIVPSEVMVVFSERLKTVRTGFHRGAMIGVELVQVWSEDGIPKAGNQGAREKVVGCVSIIILRVNKGRVRGIREGREGEVRFKERDPVCDRLQNLWKLESP